MRELVLERVLYYYERCTPAPTREQLEALSDLELLDELLDITRLNCGCWPY